MAKTLEGIMGELESRLRKSAHKKGLSGKDEKEYVGGTIGNMRKKGQLPPPKKKPPAEKRPKATRVKAPAKKKLPYSKPTLTKKVDVPAKKERIEIHVAKLSGSEKQIEWGKRIRKAYIQVMANERPQIVKKEVEGHTSAAWWIDNRYALGITTTQQREITRLAAKQ